MAYYTYKQIMYRVTPELEEQFRKTHGEEFEGTADYDGDMYTMAELIISNLEKEVEYLKGKLDDLGGKI